MKNKSNFGCFMLFMLLLLICRPMKEVQVGTAKVGEPTYGGSLIDCFSADAVVLNPILSTDTSSAKIEDIIFEGMMTYDKDMYIIPELALSWDISPNKLDYTFYLRDDVYWHDKVLFTADDVIFTWDRILDPRTNTTRDSMFYSLDFEDIPYEKLDTHTIVFHLKTTFSPMLDNMMFPIIPKHIFEPYSPAEGEGDYEFNDCPPNSHPIGTGSMMFEEWIPDDQIKLKRNSMANGCWGYWAEHDAYLSEYIVKIISNPSAQLLALKNGVIDMMDLTSTETSEVDILMDDPNFDVYSAPYFGYDHIAFNCDPSKGHHADTRDFSAEPNHFSGFTWMESNVTKLPGPNIRKALNYALDKDQLIEVAYPYGYRNLGPMYLAQTDWYYEGVERYDLDLDKANQLLNESGFGVDASDPLRKNLNFTISYEQGHLRRQTVCNYAKGSWESTLGIEVVVEPVDKDTLQSDYFGDRKFDAVAVGWTGDGGDPDIMNIWHSKYIELGIQPSNFNSTTYVWEWIIGGSQSGVLNYMAYWNPDVDNLMATAQTEPEKIVRRMYYDQIQQKIVGDSPYVWLFAHISLHAVRSTIHGMIQDSVAGLWPHPVGFHNIWKETNDQIAPTIANVQINPAELTVDTTSVNVTAVIYDISGIKSALLYVNRDGDWSNQPMSQIGTTTTYFSEIDSLGPGDFVKYYVNGTDLSNNSNIAIDDNNGLMYNFSIPNPDSIGPTYVKVYREPIVPLANEGVYIYTNVTDPSGISEVRLYWRVDNSSWLSVEMDSLGNNLYRGYLGLFAEGDCVQYYINATDNSYTKNIGSTLEMRGEPYNFTVAMFSNTTSSSQSSLTTSYSQSVPGFNYSLMLVGVISTVLIYKRRKKKQ